MSDNRSPIIKLYEYCQDKSNNLSLSDLKFEYEIKNKGKFNCIIIINNEVYKIDDLCCSSKKEAKIQIADYTYKKLIEKDNQVLEDNKNSIIKLNEYCQNKKTKINLSDKEFLYDINNDSTSNCKIKINDQIYDRNLSCKSKKAKNEIAEYVYTSLTSSDKKNNIFNDNVIKCLSNCNIEVNDLTINTMECENNKYIYIVKFNKFRDITFLALEPKTKEKLNEDFIKFLKEKFKGNNTDNKVKELNFDYYTELFKIPYNFIIERGEKDINCRCEIFGVDVGGEKIRQLDNSDGEQEIKTLIEKTKNKAAITLKAFSEQKHDDNKYLKYQNGIEITIDDLNMTKVINGILEFNDNDKLFNKYIGRITQTFTSIFSEIEENNYLYDVKKIITESLNKLKKKENLSKKYKIMNFYNYEVWNIINKKNIIYVEFEKENIRRCYNSIKEKLKNNYGNKILEMEFNEKSLNIQIKLINGSTFSIYVGTNIGGELLSKYKTPFYNCSKEERKYIQFIILWSNLVLYDVPNDRSVRIMKDDESKELVNLSSYYLKEQERIFTTLALYSWNYMSKIINNNNKAENGNLYLYSLKLLRKMIERYKKLKVGWDGKKDENFSNLIDPLSNRNLITSNNKFLWEIYQKNFKKILTMNNKNKNENNIKNNGKLNIYFEPYISNPNTFKVIKEVYFSIYEDKEITEKTSLYRISDKLPEKNKELLNILFNSLQSFLLLNICVINTSIGIQKLSNEKTDNKLKNSHKRLRYELNDEKIDNKLKNLPNRLKHESKHEKTDNKFQKFNKRLKEKLSDGISNFFKYLNEDIKIKDLENEDTDLESSEINKLYFILGDKVKITINILVKT